MKKIAISLLIVLFSIFAFFYIQLNQLKNSIADHLTQYDIQAHDFSLSLLPQPTVNLSGLKYHQLSAENIDAKFALFPLLSGNPILEEIQITHFKLSEQALNHANIHGRFTDFSLKNIFNQNIAFKGESAVTLSLYKPLYGTNTQYQFAFSKGNINLNHQGKNLIQFVNARLNQQPLGYIETYVDFSKPVKTINAYLQPDCQNCLATFKFSHKDLQSAVNFSGKNFPMAQLIALLNFPNTLTGNADFNIQLALTNSELTKGEFYFDAQNGEILGLNLLDMAAQYLPINYNSDLTASRNMNTPYERLESRLSFENHLLKVDKMNLKTTALLGEGSGAIDLDNVQCDVNLTLRSTNEKYKKLVIKEKLK
ncbi:MAG: AsmA-like C-terminal region-containing protein [Haemophilus parainfluenzae]|nr:AsmA-like C-terminal region-containing protein [Haemophilus parainfluenzae]